MSNIQKVFTRLPQAALQLVSDAATRSNRSKTDVIVWCIDVIGDNQIPSGAKIYWMAQGQRGPDAIYTEVRLLQPRRGDAGTIIVNLPRQTNNALVRATRRLSVGQDVVMASAASLAQYFGRPDGRLVCGQDIGSGRNARIRFIAYLA